MTDWRAHLAPPLVDGLWFPRYDVDEEALLEAEEADLLFALRLVRKASAVAYIGSRGKRRRGQEEEREGGARSGPGGAAPGDTTEDTAEDTPEGGSEDSVSSIESDMSYASDGSSVSVMSEV